MKEAEGKRHSNPASRVVFRSIRFGLMLAGCPLIALNVAGQAGFESCPGRSTDLFTTLADRLLRRETAVWLNANPVAFQKTFGVATNFGVNGIPVFVNNQPVYSPAVHRLLQVAANICDATHERTNLTAYPCLPGVFQPIFTTDANSNIFIAEFVEVTNTAFLQPPHRIWDLTDPDELLLLSSFFQPDDSIYNVPLVIGAKKGFPNFNEFSAQTAVTVMRRLLFHRTGPNRAPVDYVDQTNQIYTLTVSNLFGVELWNSYTNPFPRDLQLEVGAFATVILANQNGFVLASNITSVGTITNIPSNTWAGFSPQSPAFSFLVPVITNALVSTANFPASPWLTNMFFSRIDGFPIEQWFVTTRAQVRFALIDSGTGRIIDYVALSAANGPGNVTAQLMSGGTGQLNSARPGDVWCTNRLIRGVETLSSTVPTVGILNQLLVGLGPFAGGPNFYSVNWQSFNRDPSYPGDIVAAQERFIYYMFGVNTPGDNTRYPQVTNFASPFNPIRTIYQVIPLQANDPLVHYTLSDMTDLRITNTFTADVAPNSPTNSVGGLGRVNSRYSPWGGNPIRTGGPGLYDPDAFNLALKDPQVFFSSAWNFPTNGSHHFDWLGNVHRGTPWQTLYLKSPGVASLPWMSWVGDRNSYTAWFTQPTNDWRLVSELIPLLERREPHRLFSINNPDTDAWLRILGGRTVLTNSVPQPETLVMSADSPQAELIADAIERTRLAQADHYFHHVGDILETPELSVASPWLNSADGSGITDQAYETIPDQLLPLLREDSIGSITTGSSGMVVQFTGRDDCVYAVECSRNLRHWWRVGICCPTNGTFCLTMPIVPDSKTLFYRSVLIPGHSDESYPELHQRR